MRQVSSAHRVTTTLTAIGNFKLRAFPAAQLKLDPSCIRFEPFESNLTYQIPFFLFVRAGSSSSGPTHLPIQPHFYPYIVVMIVTRVQHFVSPLFFAPDRDSRITEKLVKFHQFFQKFWSNLKLTFKPFSKNQTDSTRIEHRTYHTSAQGVHHFSTASFVTKTQHNLIFNWTVSYKFKLEREYRPKSYFLACYRKSFILRNSNEILTFFQ
jgi:hypothetical protein